MTNEQKAITEQGNAAYWADIARMRRADLHAAQQAGHVALADYWRSHALAAQEYAYHSHGMALYWLGTAPFPTVL